MPRLSALIARLEDWLAPKCGNGFHRLERIGKQQYERLKRRGQIWYATHKKRLGRYIVLGLLAGYFYGMSSTPSSLERPPPSTRRARRWKASGCSIPSGTGSFYSRPLDWA